MHETRLRLDLKNRAAVITGAASGIGRALAMEAAKRGMQVALADSNAAGLREVENDVAHLGAEVFSQVLDIRNADEMTAFARTVWQSFSSIAVVFANAGVLRAGASLLPYAPDWKLIFDVNVHGTMHTVGAFAPRLVDQKQPAQFVFTGSQASLMAYRGLAAYAASKHAIWAVAEALYCELYEAESNVSVSMVCPGAVRTDIMDSSAKEKARDGLREFEQLAIENAAMTPENLAQIVFDGVTARKFWIFSHPGFKADVKARIEKILLENPPAARYAGEIRNKGL